MVHVPSLPIENHIEFICRGKIGKNALNEERELVSVEIQKTAGLPQWHQFTVSQEAHIEDYVKSPDCIDEISAFNIRQPELMIFDNLRFYSECFITIRVQKTTIC